MIEKFLRFILGYVKVDIIGGNIERFLNLVISRGIHIWNVVSSEAEVCFCITPKDVYKLKPIIEKVRRKRVTISHDNILKIRIKERYGLPFFLYAYRKRKMFFVGIFIGW